jgi:O-antigen/teichoic acid export membrane protein
MSLLLYTVIFLCAPWIAAFFEREELTALVRASSLGLIIGALGMVQQTRLTKRIDFKTQTKITIAATALSGIVGIGMAFAGFGVWALVAQQLMSQVATTLLLYIYNRWVPRLCFCKESFHDLFGFGWKMMLSALLDAVWKELYQAVVGKFYNPATLGQYTRARHYAHLFSSNLTTVVQRVTYPVLCKMKDDTERLRINYRRMLRLSAFVVFPLMCGMAGAAYPLVEVLLGHKWHYAATLLIPISFAMMWYPVHSLNLNLLQVKGRSDLFLKLEIIKKLIGVTILAISVPFGLLFMCYTKIFSALISLFINTYYTGKLIQVGFFRQLGDLSKTLVTSLCMFAIVFGINHYIDSYLVQLIADIIVGAVFYIGVAFVFKFEEVDYLKSILKKDETTR